jgi:hypothetical protein
MKNIAVYFQNVTKTSVAHVHIEDNEDIEDKISEWIKLGFVRAHFNNNSVTTYIPWVNVMFIQYASTHDEFKIV